MADENYITRLEHNEFAKRVDEKFIQQDKHIEEIDKVVKSMGDLPITVKQIIKNQEKQEKLLEEIKNKPAEQINSAKQTLINSVVSTLSQALLLGMMALIMFGLFCK